MINKNKEKQAKVEIILKKQPKGEISEKSKQAKK